MLFALIGHMRLWTYSSPVLVTIISGLVLIIVGNILVSRYIIARNRRRYPSVFRAIFGHVASVAGLVLFGLGIWSGFFSPVTIGRFTLQPFAFSPASPGARKAALNYSKSWLRISCQPAVGWHGASSRSLLFTVHNKGKREIAYVILRFQTAGGSYDKKLFGPFSPDDTARAVLNLPPEVDRMYFQGTHSIHSTSIVEARF